MESWKYRLVTGIIQMTARLPMKMLYGIGDLLFFVVYYGLRYRRRVVMENLFHAFPEKTDAERQAIARRFYHHLIDSLMEILKMTVASPEQMQKFYNFDGSVFDPYYQQKKTVYVALSHQFNWELGAWLLKSRIQSDWAVIYTPLSSPLFERFFHAVRTRTGAHFYSPKQIPSLVKHTRQHPTVIGLAADQSPAHLPSARWCQFMNRYAPFHPGIEDLARKFGGTVVFMAIIREKRGKYRAEITVATEDARALPEGALTDAYVAFTEASIRRQPENYLWSHRRWKHSNKYEQYRKKENDAEN